MHLIIQSFNQYGYLVLLICLSLELAAFPLPGEALMIYCGYIVYLKKLDWATSILSATIGAAMGITFSYLIGKVLGGDFFKKYNKRVLISKKRLDTVSKFFRKYNTWIIFLAYFIPGMRHVMGYFCGIIKVPYKSFSLSAYMGAAAWTTTFISMGNLLGASWSKSSGLMRYITVGFIATLLVILTYMYVRYKNREKLIIRNDGGQN